MGKYPDGWFNGFDIQAYRSIMSKVPRGGTVVEIGSYKGRSLATVAEIIKVRKLSVVAVDPFLTFTQDESAEMQARRRLSQTLKRLGFRVKIAPKPTQTGFDKEVEASFWSMLDDFGLTDNVALLTMQSVKASRSFNTRSIDLVFIDGDHSYDGIVKDVYSWWPKLKKRGVIAGHDYTQAGGTILMHEVRAALHDVFGGPEGVDGTTHHPRSTCWVATRAPIFSEQLS